MKKKTIVSLRTYAEIERGRENRRAVVLAVWFVIVAAAAYFTAHLAYAVVR